MLSKNNSQAPRKTGTSRPVRGGQNGKADAQVQPKPARHGGVNKVRIIGGDKRRQLIQFPDSLALRPTPDRVRETLFNWLGQELDGQNCLDLFAGSGALGFEAASRGAERVVMVDCMPAVLASLRQNLTKLGFTDNVEIVGANALEFAASLKQGFDLVFLDPPYHQGWLEKLEPLLPKLLKPEGRLYLEAEQPVKAFAGWQTIREGKAGQVYYHLLANPLTTLAAA